MPLRRFAVALALACAPLLPFAAGGAGRARALPVDTASSSRGSEATPAVGWGPDGFAGGAGRARALPVDTDQGEREGPASACVKVSTEAPYRAYGYDHIVTLKNNCDKPMRCSVTTDVNPTPTTVELDVGEEKSVLTYRGSPAREFNANADCKPQ